MSRDLYYIIIVSLYFKSKVLITCVYPSILRDIPLNGVFTRKFPCFNRVNCIAHTSRDLFARCKRTVGDNRTSVPFEAASTRGVPSRSPRLDLNAYEDFGGAAPCTCMRATRIAMVSYFQVTLWREEREIRASSVTHRRSLTQARE